MAKQRIYLSNIVLHVRGGRPTTNFSKVAEKGRMYSPLSPSDAETANKKDCTATASFELPEDLREKIERGEIELMVPDDGLPVYAGKDVYEFIEKRERKERRKRIPHVRTWHSDKEAVE